MTFLWTVTYTPDTARYSNMVSRFPVWVYANTKEKWDSLAYWVPIGRDFMDKVADNKVPMIIEGSWQDKFFNADGLIQAASLMQVPFRLYLGAVIGHGGDHSPTEDIWHMQFFNDWFFYWLFGMENGTMNAPKYQYASTVLPFQNNMWTFVHDSSTVPLDRMTTDYRLFFNRNNKLAPKINSKTTEKISFNNSVSKKLTMQEAVDEEFTGRTFRSRFKVSSLIFDTDPLPADVKWIGTPKIQLTYTSNGKDFCQYNFQVFEVTPDRKAGLTRRIQNNLYS
jgi:predicted acyl esterase